MFRQVLFVTLSFFKRIFISLAAHASGEQVLFVDSAVDGYQRLLSGASVDGKDIHIIPKGVDGVRFIAKTLTGHRDVDALHIVSHSSEGELQLGSVSLSQETFVNYRRTF